MSSLTFTAVILSERSEREDPPHRTAISIITSNLWRSEAQSKDLGVGAFTLFLRLRLDFSTTLEMTYMGYYFFAVGDPHALRAQDDAGKRKLRVNIKIERAALTFPTVILRERRSATVRIPDGREVNCFVKKI